MAARSMHKCCSLALLLVLSFVSSACGQTSGNATASLKVGDYAAGQLTNGSALPLYTLLWRAVGSTFSGDSLALNQTFAENANTAFLAAPHTMAYTVVNLRNAAAANTTRRLNGVAVAQVSDPTNPAYSSADLLLRATFNQDSVWEDLGVTEQTYRQQVSANLLSYGWNMTAVVPMGIEITTEAAHILTLMPLPGYSSYKVVLQVSGTNVVPMSMQTQNLISDTLLTLLASDHVFLIRLTEVDETSPVNGVGSATMTYVMQKAAATTDVMTALGLVLGNPSTTGSQAASAFSATMNNHSINATAVVVSQASVSGDSMQDQIYALTHTVSSSRKHLGAILGSAIGSAVVLLLLLVAATLFGRGWLKKRRLQKESATWNLWNKDGVTDVEGGKTIFHDSGSSLTDQASPGFPAGDEAAAAHCWDIAASDIVICKRPDGSDWLLNVSESGEVYRALRSGVQDVVVKVLTSSNSSAKQDLSKEVEVLKSVSYDRNVVQFYGTCVLGDQTMLVLEYMEGGDLRHALTNSSNGELQWRNKGASIALDLVRGLHFLHSHGVVHMDLKASNTLLTKTYSIAKIGDVDRAQFMGSITLQRPHAATFAYSAPELILNGACTEQVDMYSLGVVLWELITTEVPRRGRLRAMKVPEECPAEIEQLIDLCLATEPADRPTAKQAFDTISACSPHLAAPSPPIPPPATHGRSGPHLADSQASRHSAEASSSSNGQVPASQGQGKANTRRQQLSAVSMPGRAQSIQLPPWQSQQAHSKAGPASVQLSLLDSNSDRQGPSGAAQTVQVPPEPLGRNQSNAIQHQMPATLQAAQDIRQHRWLAEHGQEDFLAAGQDESSSYASGGLPLGVQGHLYPSPFAFAADDSGPLWSWHNGQNAA